MTLLAASIFVESAEQGLARAAQAAERGADLVEYRLDTMVGREAEATRLVQASPLPCIATVRPAWEGGLYEGEEGPRIELLERLVASPRPPRFVDVEWAAYGSDSRLRQRVDRLLTGAGLRPTLILSTHDLRTRPPDLLQRVAAMAGQPRCGVVKVAWMARSLRDNLEAFELLRSAPKPMIALCMGPFGLPSRILARKFAAHLTFASVEEGAETAEGQVDLAAVKDLYGWDRMDGATRVYGVIGWPVTHSLSPAIHNRGFEAVGHNGVYLPMPVPDAYEHFKATVAAWLDDAALHFRGASVTIPHKEHLVRFVRSAGGVVDPLAERLAAANTLTVGEDGSLHASNTDYDAALDAVCETLGIERRQLRKRRVAVLGAGGAARAVAAAFAHHGATVVLYNRTLARAQRLADELERAGGAKVVAQPLERLGRSCCEVYVNCTSVGMHPDVDRTPMPDLPGGLAGAVVFDTIYNPAETRLLREARAAGARTIGGVEMFVRQAAGQFEGWTGRPAPVDRFAQCVRDRLAPAGVPER